MREEQELSAPWAQRAVATRVTPRTISAAASATAATETAIPDTPHTAAAAVSVAPWEAVAFPTSETALPLEAKIFLHHRIIGGIHQVILGTVGVVVGGSASGQSKVRIPSQS